VTLQSQAQRCAVLEEMGKENSVSAPGAPATSSRVSIELVTCIWIFLLVAGKLDQGVSQSLRAAAVIVFTCAPGQGLERVPHDGAAD